MRLFIALPVSDEVRQHVRRAVEPLWKDDRLAWTRPDGWHVTLAFLGEVDDDPDDIADVLRPVVAAHGSIILSTGPVTLLGRGAVTLLVEDRPRDAVNLLASDVRRALAPGDVPVLPRGIVPHLTLARPRRQATVPPEVRDWDGPEPVSWTADRVEIVQSVLGRGPARYVTQASIDLAGR
jgi:RNA 2',3'-cyclic 3'-phosphodiesterase